FRTPSGQPLVDGYKITSNLGLRVVSTQNTQILASGDGTAMETVKSPNGVNGVVRQAALALASKFPQRERSSDAPQPMPQ
ncbi:MAG: hypothetical protein ACRELB_20125, partial [Polyangiaceae bacterium]